MKECTENCYGPPPLVALSSLNYLSIDIIILIGLRGYFFHKGALTSDDVYHCFLWEKYKVVGKPKLNHFQHYF